MRLVDVFIDVEHSIDHAFHFDMRVEIKSTLRQRGNKAPEFREGLRGRRGSRTQELREKRQIGTLTPTDIIEIIIALERNQLFDLSNGDIELRRRSWHAEDRIERTDIQFAFGSERSVRFVMLVADAASAGVEPGGDAKRVEPGHELSRIGNPGVKTLEWNIRRDEGDAAPARHEPIRPAIGVALDLAARWIGGTRIDIRRLHSRGVEHRVIVNRL